MRRIARSVEIASLLALVAACNPGESPAIANTPNAPVSPQNPPTIAGAPAVAKGIPHAGIINEVAITEQADAALSFDILLGIRLWPTLDGSRPPVPVTANAPRDLAIAHAGRDLMAVVLDDAGAVSVLRLGLDGSLHGKVTLPGQYKQALATEAGVIVRTPDHAIEWYAPDGTPKGRVVPEPGQEIESIATRNGHTAALLADATTNIARNIRWLTLGDTLGWGMTVEVPGPVANGLFAISPNNHRVAYTNNGAVEVYEIDPFMRVVKGENVVPHSETDRGIGFIDDDRVVLGAVSMVALWVAAKPPAPAPKPEPANDPWAVPTTWVNGSGGFMHMSLPADTSLMDGFAYGDSVVVTGVGVTLAISTELSTRYLGWKQLASGNLSNAGDRIVMAMSGSRFVWLDSGLDVKDDVELHDSPTAPWMYGVPVGDHHVVTQTSHDNKYEVALYDTHTKASSKPNVYKETERLEYTPASNMFAVGERNRLYRFKLDLEMNAMVPLSPIRVKGSPINIRLFDPAKANGVTAAVVGWDSDYADYQTLTIYREKGKPTRIHPFNGTLLSEDEDGTLYVYMRNDKTELSVIKDGKVTRKIDLGIVGVPTLTHDASRIAYTDAKGAVVVKDLATNKELWHQPMWGAQQVLFTADAKKVVVRAIGGVATFDATTGIRTGLECGWNFGLYEEALGSSPPGQSLVCEDPMLQ